MVSSPFSGVSPATTVSGGALAMPCGALWAYSHPINVGFDAHSHAWKPCIARGVHPELLSAKKWRRCSAWPAHTFLPARGGKEDPSLRRSKGASDSFQKSSVSFNRVLGTHRSGDNESPREEIRDVPNLGSMAVDADSPRSIEDEGGKESPPYGICLCHMCRRRGLMASLGGLLALSKHMRAASAAGLDSSDYNTIREAMHPARPSWYEELYAQAMARTMASYEAEVADVKRQLFRNLDENVEHVLELGIGTGPNLKYYGNMAHLQRVVGLDPNLQMAKYCAESATAVGLSKSRFEFLNAVGEGIPLRNESMDAVVSTLTLCSVTDVTLTLKEVKRVLRPGGAFLFVEHVAAPEGTGLRFWQGLLDPLQQWVADGCHLTRNTLQYIGAAQFGSVQSQSFTVSSVSIFGPHIMGVAYK